MAPFPWLQISFQKSHDLCPLLNGKFSFSSRWVGEGCSVLTSFSVHLPAGMKPWKALLCTQPLDSICWTPWTTVHWDYWRARFSFSCWCLCLGKWVIFHWQSIISEGRESHPWFLAYPFPVFPSGLALILPPHSRRHKAHSAAPTVACLLFWETPTFRPPSQGPGSSPQVSPTLFKRERPLMQGLEWRGQLLRSKGLAVGEVRRESNAPRLFFGGKAPGRSSHCLLDEFLKDASLLLGGKTAPKIMERHLVVAAPQALGDGGPGPHGFAPICCIPAAAFCLLEGDRLVVWACAVHAPCPPRAFLPAHRLRGKVPPPTSGWAPGRGAGALTDWGVRRGVDNGPGFVWWVSWARLLSDDSAMRALWHRWFSSEALPCWPPWNSKISRDRLSPERVVRPRPPGLISGPGWAAAKLGTTRPVLSAPGSPTRAFFSLHTRSHKTHPAGSSCAQFAFPRDSTFHPPGPAPGPSSQASAIKKR